MKRTVLLLLSCMLMLSCLTGCAREATVELIEYVNAPGEPTAEEYTTLTGYILKTDLSIFFVAAEDTRLLKKDQFVILLTSGTEFDLSTCQTGDPVEIRLWAIKEIYPPQARLYGFTSLTDRETGAIPSTVMDAVEELGYRVIP